MSDDDKQKTEHNRNLSNAWGAGHIAAVAKWGESRGPAYFTGTLGNTLMAKLDALPLGTPADEFQALVEQHVETEIV